MRDQSTAIVEWRLKDEGGAVRSDLDGLQVVGWQRNLRRILRRDGQW